MIIRKLFIKFFLSSCIYTNSHTRYTHRHARSLELIPSLIEGRKSRSAEIWSVSAIRNAGSTSLLPELDLIFDFKHAHKNSMLRPNNLSRYLFAGAV